MAIYYGVKRDFAAADYNVDTYVTWDQMLAMAANDYLNVSCGAHRAHVREPAVSGQAGQPQPITMERVIEVMARAGTAHMIRHLHRSAEGNAAWRSSRACCCSSSSRSWR